MTTKGDQVRIWKVTTAAISRHLTLISGIRGTQSAKITAPFRTNTPWSPCTRFCPVGFPLEVGLHLYFAVVVFQKRRAKIKHGITTRNNETGRDYVHHINDSVFTIRYINKNINNIIII
jgi:hypothetical protein